MASPIFAGLAFFWLAPVQAQDNLTATALPTTTAAVLDRQLQQAIDELQAIKNHQAVTPWSMFHWSEPRLWLLLLILVAVLLLLIYVRQRTLRPVKPTPLNLIENVVLPALPRLSKQVKVRPVKAQKRSVRRRPPNSSLNP
ncbi:MAG: hypothetical protein V1846_01790 [Candidatus Komeilibacteria bacterium]